MPGLVAVLGCGMLLGTDGLGWIAFDDPRAARTIGTVALALILFEGGLAAGFSEIRPVLGPASALALLGTLLTALVAGVAAHLLFDLSLLEGLLLGSILSATDGAATFALLRGSTLRRRVARTLEGESGLNDPIAVLLVLGFVDWITKPHYGVADMLLLLVRQLGIGLAAGAAVGAGAVWVLRRVRLASAGLYPVASLAAVALAFGTADTLHGSGFLAVYLTGLSLGSVRTPAQRTVAAFHDGVAWLAQLALFLSLGLLVFPSRLPDVAVEGTALALVLVFVARPLATIVATTGFGFDVRERAVLGWAGLRGGVPVVLATFPVIAGVHGSQAFFDVVFFAVVLSTILQGTTFEAVARLLGVTTEEAAVPRPLIEPSTVRRLGAEIAEFAVHDGDAAAGRRVRELELPRDALLNLIIRGEQAIPPRGSTVVRPGDRLHVLVRQEVAVEFTALLRRWREGPLGVAVARDASPVRSTLFSTRPWNSDEGDPGRPSTVSGVPVTQRVRSRRDRPGALVELADGRYAFTGPIVAVGPRAAVQEAARRRLAWASDEEETGWWREVVGALAR